MGFFNVYMLSLFVEQELAAKESNIPTPSEHDGDSHDDDEEEEEEEDEEKAEDEEHDDNGSDMDANEDN